MSLNIRQLPPVYDGLTIIVQGTILPNASGFAMNLCSGPNFPQCDRAVHVNPRYSQNNVVVRNTLGDGEWGVEERDGPPFHVPRGQNCECIILVTNACIKFAFNGQHYCDFVHRFPKERITHIVVSGDMQVQNITFYGPGVPMGVQGGAYGGPIVGAASLPPIAGGFSPAGAPYPAAVASYPAPYNPSFPTPSGYVAPSPQGYGHNPAHPSPGKQYLPGGLFPGRLIYVTVTPGPNTFAVNLRFQEQGGDIAFHFNPRMIDRIVVRNSHLNGAWGTEERDTPRFPFQPGHPCYLIFLIEHDKFKVAVNNQHYLEYRMRTQNMQAIQWIEITGDGSNPFIYVQ